MNLDEILVHVLKGDRRDMIFELLAEGVCKASEAPHLNPHSAPLAFDVAGRYVPCIRIANPGFSCSQCKRRGCIASVFDIAAVNLDQHWVVDIFAEAVRCGSQVCLESVGRRLNAIDMAACEILNKLRSAASIAPTNKPGTNQFGPHRWLPRSTYRPVMRARAISFVTFFSLA